MSNLQRRLILGERVMTMTDLSAPLAEPQGKSVKIPIASCGVVKDVLPRDCPKPYIVEFMVDENVVEVSVTPTEVVSVTLYTPEPLFEPEKPAYVPTYRHPHRFCKVAHVVNGLLLGGVYATTLWSNTYGLLLLSVLVLGLMYAWQYWVTRSWSWIPDVLRREEPSEGEGLVVNPRYLGLVPYADVTMTVGFAAVLTHYTIAVFNPGFASVGTYIVLAFVAFAAVVIDQIIHDKAVRIVLWGAGN
jgi:hypothetical protein